MRDARRDGGAAVARSRATPRVHIHTASLLLHCGRPACSAPLATRTATPTSSARSAEAALRLATWPRSARTLRATHRRGGRRPRRAPPLRPRRRRVRRRPLPRVRRALAAGRPAAAAAGARRVFGAVRLHDATEGRRRARDRLLLLLGRAPARAEREPRRPSLRIGRGLRVGRPGSGGGGGASARAAAQPQSRVAELQQIVGGEQVREFINKSDAGSATLIYNA